jgi:phosphoesterase RecJ-like protein
MADAPAKNLKLAGMDIPASLRAAVEESQRIFCLSHPSADGDAVGSLCGLYHALSALGKDVSLVLPDPKPQYLRYIPGWETILSYEEDPETVQQKAQQAELFFAVDFGKWDRIPEALQALIPRDRLVWIDHHADSEPLSAVWNIWQPTAAATTEILYEFLTQLLKRPLPLSVRIALYTGLLTDTGGFRFRSVTPKTFQIAANLIEPPFPLEAIHHHVFRNKPLHQMRLQSYLFQHQLYRLDDLPVLMLSIPVRVLEELGATWEDVQALSNQLLSLEGALLSIVLKEYGPMETRLSIRGAGDFPCHELAARFDRGGGHRNAAGATLYQPLSQAITHTENLIRTEYAPDILREFERFTRSLELHQYA